MAGGPSPGVPAAVATPVPAILDTRYVRAKGSCVALPLMHAAVQVQGTTLVAAGKPGQK